MSCKIELNYDELAVGCLLREINNFDLITQAWMIIHSLLAKGTLLLKFVDVSVRI